MPLGVFLPVDCTGNSIAAVEKHFSHKKRGKNRITGAAPQGCTGQPQPKSTLYNTYHTTTLLWGYYLYLEFPNQQCAGRGRPG